MFRVIGLVCLSLFILTGCNKKAKTAADLTTTVFSDDFNRTPATFPDTTDWFIDSSYGSATLTGTKLQLLPGGSSTVFAGYNSILTLTTWATSGTFSISGGTAPTIPVMGVLADLNAKSGASVTSYYFCGFDFTNTLRIVRNGVAVTTGSAVTFTNSMSILISMSMVDGDITCSTAGDDSQTITYTDSSPLTSGYFGFLGGQPSSTNTYIDDYVVGGI